MHMNFSEDSQHSYFFSQPHQPFFILAFTNALAIMFIFMLSYKGILHMNISAIDYHAYGFIYLLFTPAFFGFLLTTFPRFASTPPIEKKQYMRVFDFYYIGSALVILGSIATPLFTAFGMLIVFLGHLKGTLILKNIYTSTQMEDKHDIFWILLAMSVGVGAHALLIIGSLLHIGMTGFATEIAIYLYLFMVAFSVAQRMVPFFSHCMVEKNHNLLKILFVLLTLHILIEGFVTNGSFLIDLLIGALLSKELLRWKLPFPNPNPLLWILHIALYWTGLAFILGGITNFITLLSNINFLALDIHVLVLGFVFTILIGFGTRVTLGHSGNRMQADRYTTFLFYWTQVVVLTRILTSIIAAFGWNFMVLFDITASAWLVMFVAWAVHFFAVLIYGKKFVN
ncbi:MAG TPA: NnrS family protein [Epsilonproteobacteria bacterium]|nr:NnrS family protein [Campylobacterota bacterium]HHE06215.1 NnrS family protein [Campylobacterota bacterium]